MPIASKVFVCQLCRAKFSMADVDELKYFPSTGVCAKCYKEAQEDKTVCFGKKKRYQPDSKACSEICVDRKICALYVKLEKINGKKDS